MVLPFVISLIAYLRTGQFSDPEPLRHQAEPARTAPLLTTPSPERMAVGAAEPAAADEPALATAAAVSPTDNRLVLRAVVVTAGVLAALIFFAKRYEAPETPVKVDRATAFATADEFLTTRGLSTGGFRRVYDFSPAMGDNEPRYVMQQSGLAGLKKTYPSELPAQLWTVRLFKELDAQELRVMVEATTGRVVGFEHRIAEKDSLGSVTAAEAESLSAGLLASVGLSTAGMDRKEAADDPRPHRMDRHFAWEGADGDKRNVGEARYRLESKVAGNTATGLGVTMRLPEAYERLRNKRTAVTGILIGIMILGGLGCFGIALRDASRAHMSGVIPWKRMLRFGVVGLAFAVIGAVNGWPRFVYNYQSTMAWSSHLVLFGVGLATASVLYFFLGWVLTALGRGLQPSVKLLGDPGAWGEMLPGALLALVLVPAWAKALGLTRVFFAGVFPRFAAPPGLDMAGYMDMLSPGLAVIVSTLVSTFLSGFVIAALLRILPSQDWPGRPLRLALFAALVVGLTVGPTRGMGEAAVALARAVLILAVAFGLVRWVLRDNPLAYLAGLYGFFAFRGVGGLLEQPTTWARTQGIVALVVLLVPVAWMAMRGRSKAARV